MCGEEEFISTDSFDIYGESQKSILRFVSKVV